MSLVLVELARLLVLAGQALGLHHGAQEVDRLVLGAGMARNAMVMT